MALGDKERAEQLIVSSSSDTVKYEENNTRQISLAKNKKDGESVGFLEVPKYINKEVEKALDIKVDELVRSRKDLPDVVLRSIYEEALDTIASQSIEIEDLETNVNDLTADLIAMTADRDTQRELKISAELSLSAVTLTDDIKINTKRLKKSYKVGSTPKIEVHGRELYPSRTFSNTFAYNDVNYLPTSSYYQISDLNSNDIIIPFGDYSKISCNASGNYFKLNLLNFEINRDYKVEFKIERSGTVEYFDDDITFEVVK